MQLVPQRPACADGFAKIYFAQHIQECRLAGPDGRTPRLAAEQGFFAKALAHLQRRDKACLIVLDPLDIDRAFADDVKTLALVALAEDYITGRFG
jgi:hypothetical protein